MKNPIFVFSDDLDIFKTSQAAEGYMEPWLIGRKVSTFDSDGQVLICSVEKKPSKFLWGIFGASTETVKIAPSQKIGREAFREQLVAYLKRLAEHSGRQLPPDLPQAGLTTLVQAAVEMKGYTS